MRRQVASNVTTRKRKGYTTRCGPTNEAEQATGSSSGSADPSDGGHDVLKHLVTSDGSQIRLAGPEREGSPERKALRRGGGQEDQSTLESTTKKTEQPLLIRLDTLAYVGSNAPL